MRFIGPVMIMLFLNSFCFGEVAGKVDRFLEVSGCNRQIAHFPEIMKKGVEVAGRRYVRSSPEFVELLKRLVSRNFTVESMKSGIRSSLIAGLNDSELDTVLAFYKTDLARRITELEVKGSDPSIMERLNSFDPETVPAEKRNEIDRIFTSLKFMENFIDTQETVMIAMAAVMNSGLPESKRKSEQQILSAFRDRLKERNTYYERLVKNNLYIIYSEAGMQEIRQYRRFLETPEAQKVNRLFFYGKREALRKAAENFGRELMEEIKKNPKVKEGVRG